MELQNSKKLRQNTFLTVLLNMIFTLFLPQRPKNMLLQVLQVLLLIFYII
jgi:hypothetical protein